LRLAVLAVGRMKAGPERELFERYVKRVSGLAPSLGFSPIEWRELDESRARQAETRRAEEGKILLAAAPKGAFLIALDERGASPSSDAFAREFLRTRDSGAAALAFLIGGPDGLDPALRASAQRIISFGAMTWPHQLVRVMAAEQIYRAMTILAGHPYHRG
jgi:23S rRNA (pseudouridine1915-N3)-methyltransferase